MAALVTRGVTCADYSSRRFAPFVCTSDRLAGGHPPRKRLLSRRGASLRPWGGASRAPAASLRERRYRRPLTLPPRPPLDRVRRGERGIFPEGDELAGRFRDLRNRRPIDKVTEHDLPAHIAMPFAMRLSIAERTAPISAVQLPPTGPHSVASDLIRDAMERLRIPSAKYTPFTVSLNIDAMLASEGYR